MIINVYIGDIRKFLLDILHHFASSLRARQAHQTSVSRQQEASIRLKGSKEEKLEASS
jgi:hypothetical protein